MSPHLLYPLCLLASLAVNVPLAVCLHGRKSRASRISVVSRSNVVPLTSRNGVRLVPVQKRGESA